MDGMTAVSELDKVADKISIEIAGPLNDLLGCSIEHQLPLNRVHDGLWHDQEGRSYHTLDGFTGYIDCETTGLSYSSVVTCAVAIGSIAGTSGVWYISHPQGMESLPIFRSWVANWSQPFDRSFYEIEGGVDTNHHLDLKGLSIAVRGIPEEWLVKKNRQTWEPYCVEDNSLASAMFFHLGEHLDKSVRSDMVKMYQGVGSKVVSPDEILDYCYLDTLATVKVGKIVLAEYLACTPNPISVWGHILRHKFVLPMSDKFDGYYDRCESWYQDVLTYQKSVILDRLFESVVSDDAWATHIREQYPDRYQPRWIAGGVKFLCSFKLVGRGKRKTVKSPTGNLIKVWLLNLCYPVWVDDLVDLMTWEYFWDVYLNPIKPRSAIVSLLLGLVWKGNPVRYDRKQQQWFTVDGDMPNLGDPSSKLSTPLSKEYIKLLSGKDGIEPMLQCPNLPKQFTDGLVSSVCWQMFRGRMAELKGTSDGWLVPRFQPTGTLTGRATDRILLLISKPKPYLAGSEFLSLIEAPSGYKIVQADIDSGELVIAGWISASRAGIAVEDEDQFAHANLSGSKEDETDLHSLVAKQIGVTRSKAKNFNYGAQYGQGDEARINQIMRDSGCSREDAELLSSRFKDAYILGVAKYYFEGIKMMADLRMPSFLLGRSMPQAYLHCDKKEGVTSIRNHNIQTLGEDWLSCLISHLWYVMATEYPEVDYQLILTRHDEPVYLVEEGFADQFVEVMQRTHELVKWALLSRFGITEAHPVWLKYASVDVNDRYLPSPDYNPSTLTTQFN
jgi:DNA polymerase family A